MSTPISAMMHTPVQQRPSAMQQGAQAAQARQKAAASNNDHDGDVDTGPEVGGREPGKGLHVDVKA